MRPRLENTLRLPPPTRELLSFPVNTQTLNTFLESFWRLPLVGPTVLGFRHDASTPYILGLLRLSFDLASLSPESLAEKVKVVENLPKTATKSAMVVWQHEQADGYQLTVFGKLPMTTFFRLSLARRLLYGQLLDKKLHTTYSKARPPKSLPRGSHLR